MTYVYLNKYPKGYMYIGIHSWKGEGLDPNYHGSSAVANAYGWDPVSEVILEEVSEARLLIAERYWIEKYAEQYGIADCALCRYPDSVRHPAVVKWISKFKRNGLMLNLHAEKSGYAYGIAAHDEESYQQMMNTRRSNCDHKDNIRKMIDAAHTKEALMQALHTRIINGSQERSQRAATLARDKAVKTRCRNASQYKCISPDGDVFIGSNSEVNRFVKSKGYNTHVDGILSQLRSGVFNSPHKCVRGSLKNFIFEYV